LKIIKIKLGLSALFYYIIIAIYLKALLAPQGEVGYIVTNHKT
tara:strand:+ start:642 stop:770 length:129 start_codon:yes stop_codon:yes gene_type:complete